LVLENLAEPPLIISAAYPLEHRVDCRRPGKDVRPEPRQRTSVELEHGTAPEHGLRTSAAKDEPWCAGPWLAPRPQRPATTHAQMRANDDTTLETQDQVLPDGFDRFEPPAVEVDGGESGACARMRHLDLEPIANERLETVGYPVEGVSLRHRSGPEHRPARPREEAGLDEQRHHVAFRHRLAVEPLDGQPLRATAPHMRDESRERRPQPRLVGIQQRNERTAAALDVQHRLTAQQHNVCASDTRGPGARALRPRQRSAIGLRRISGGKNLRRRLLPSLTQLAEPLDRATERELCATKTLDEVAAPAQAQRLERAQLSIDRAVPAGDAFGPNTISRHDSLPLEQ
jgi:hypothetical protein